jgi:hypothetical protein
MQSRINRFNLRGRDHADSDFAYQTYSKARIMS